jgi:hypothetical protein
MSHPTRYGAFLAGGLVYFWLWKHFFRKRAWGSMLSTLEHELTHALFGLLTFRMARSLKVTWNSGGHVTFQGPVNWLILIAPYWFPTATFALFSLLYLGVLEPSPTLSAWLGISVAYHLTSTWIETHSEQSDLSRAGFLFCWCTLPFLNTCAYGLIFAGIVGGPERAQSYFVEVFTRSWQSTLLVFS